ncbi:MAG: VanZ family protein [Candidatus Methylomirabilales bacterium]
MEIEVRPRDGLLTLAYLAGIYSLSFLPGLGMREGDPLVALASNLLHIPIFAGLTFCVFQAVSAREGRQGIPGRFAALTFLGAGALAALDEWHQSFVPGRHASEGDFLLDIVGIGGMLLILHLRGLREMDRSRKIP